MIDSVSAQVNKTAFSSVLQSKYRIKKKQPCFVGFQQSGVNFKVLFFFSGKCSAYISVPVVSYFLGDCCSFRAKYTYIFLFSSSNRCRSSSTKLLSRRGPVCRHLGVHIGPRWSIRRDTKRSLGKRYFSVRYETCALCNVETSINRSFFFMPLYCF